MSTAKKSSRARNTAIQAARQVEVLVIGAGVSGIGAAIRLLQEGITDFVVLEKAQDLGGTWRDNTYPGCACDVPSALYSYSFAQNPEWTRAFAAQREILDYVRKTATEHGVHPYIRFGVDMEDAVWDEAARHWKIHTSSGLYEARTLISCAGYLHEPVIPNLPGLKDFKGTIFHSSQWNHQHDLSGERVAVIGSGASAIQFVPEIQPKVDSLFFYQRTPTWVLPKPDRRIPDIEKSFYKLPFTLNAWRKTLYSSMEVMGLGFRNPRVMEAAQQIGLAHLKRSVPDLELRAKLTPGFTLGCKRILLSNNYYPALMQPNVEVLATGVREVRGNVVIGADGSAREVDTIILATGFHVSDAPIAQRIRGSEGKPLSDIWKGSPEAYLGTIIAGFPNAFLVLGPNLAIGHNSAFVIIEAQLDYVMNALRAMKNQRLNRLEVRRDVQDRYNTAIQRDLQGTVWNAGGCSSYYIDKNGKNSICFPWTTLTMRRLMSRFDPTEYTTGDTTTSATASSGTTTVTTTAATTQGTTS